MISEITSERGPSQVLVLEVLVLVLVLEVELVEEEPVEEEPVEVEVGDVSEPVSFLDVGSLFSSPAHPSRTTISQRTLRFKDTSSKRIVRSASCRLVRGRWGWV
jgi:hypothetical protein